jgi:hypothetical protein
MATLVFRCPSSGSRIESGIHTDEASLQRVGFLRVSLYCPKCRTIHQLRACDGVLPADDDGPLMLAMGLDPGRKSN